MQPIRSTERPSAKRLVLFVADGLRADSLFENQMERAPFLKNIVEKHGVSGISHTRVPTESRPGHVSLIAGFYEDVSAVTRGWKLNPVDFDSCFNQTKHTFSFGSPDILPMFATGASNHQVETWMYDQDQEDFSKDATKLDTWVFDRVNELFLNATLDSELKGKLESNEIILFLHLLGLDTNGHAFKPHSVEYKNNIVLVDAGISQVVELINDFYKDDQTAYVFTADHGMSNIGNHGDGHPDNTRTPLIVWGSGITKIREPISIEQADIAPLMSALIGIPFPMNSVGQLPIELLNLPINDKFELLKNNALQLLQQFAIKQQLKKSTSVWFQPFKPLLNWEESLKEIESISLVNAVEATAALKKLFKSCLQGLRYYETYDWFFLKFIITFGYIGWMIFGLSRIVDDRVFYFPTFNTVLVYSTLCFVLEYQQSPAQYYAYLLLPIYFMQSTSTASVQSLYSMIVKSKYEFIQFLLIIQALAFTYFYRSLLSALLVIQAFKSSPNALWYSVVCSVFLFVPVEKTDNIWLVVIGGLIVIAMFYVSRLHKLQKFDKFQSSLVFSSVVLVYLTDFCLVNRLDILKSLQVVNSVISIISFCWIFKKSDSQIHGLWMIFMGFAPVFIFFSISYEVLFYCAFFKCLVEWFSQESSILEKTNAFSSRNLRIAAQYLIFINLSFFGTGNIASVSSFNLDSVYRFTTVFNPFLMGLLLIFKILVPFFLLTCCCCAILKSTSVNSNEFMVIIFSVSDLTTLFFFHMVRDNGSWLEIGTSISHFIISSFFGLFQTILFLIGNKVAQP